jgi:ribosome maturation factor RimP
VSKGLEEKITEDVSTLVEAILEHELCELVDVEYRREANGWVLRVLIEKDGGVTIADCSSLSRQLSDVLDVKNIIPYSYNLEVSSPGLNRRLKKEKDYTVSLGEIITLKTDRLLEGRKNFKGKLVEFRDNTIFLESEDRRWEIPVSSVIKANKEFDFTKENKRGRK